MHTVLCQQPAKLAARQSLSSGHHSSAHFPTYSRCVTSQFVFSPLTFFLCGIFTRDVEACLNFMQQALWCGVVIPRKIRLPGVVIASAAVHTHSSCVTRKHDVWYVHFEWGKWVWGYWYMWQICVCEKCKAVLKKSRVCFLLQLMALLLHTMINPIKSIKKMTENYILFGKKMLLKPFDEIHKKHFAISFFIIYTYRWDQLWYVGLMIIQYIEEKMDEVITGFQGRFWSYKWVRGLRNECVKVDTNTRKRNKKRHRRHIEKIRIKQQ